jgi:hypothetical protein
MPNLHKPFRATLARLPLLALGLGALALAGCESERDRKLEERIAAAEAKANAAEKRAAAAEAAAGNTSPVTVGTVDDSADSDANPDDQPADPDQAQQESDAQPEVDFVPEGDGPQLVIQPPPPQGVPGPVDVGTVPVAS